MDENASTPRRRAPQLTEGNSPHTVRPLPTLDLSDEESCAAGTVLPTLAKPEYDSDSEVIINYSRLSQKTPVRVIRHKMPSDSSRLLTDVNHEEDIKLNVRVTRHYETESDNSHVIFKSPSLSAEPSGSALIHYKALMELSEKSRSPVVLTSTSQQREITESSANIGKASNKSTSTHAATSVTEDAKINPKKKAGRVVPARYMQPKGPLKATDHTILQSKFSTAGAGAAAAAGASGSIAVGKSKRNSSLTSAVKKDASKSCAESPKISNNDVVEKKKSGPSGGGRMKRSTSGPSLMLCTPLPCPTEDVRGAKGKGRGLVSTPTADGSLFVAPDTVDVSAIAPVSVRHPPNMMQSYMDEGCSGQTVFKSNLYSSSSYGSTRFRVNTSEGLELKNLEQQASDSSKSKAEKDITQTDIDLAFGRQVQWVYLASLAKKTFREQEKNALADIQALWEAVEGQKKRVNDLRSELTEINYHSNLKEMLQLQTSSVTSIESKLAPLCDEYTSLVTAIMDMSHHLKTRGIYIPADSQKYMDDMRAVISESYQLLSQLISAISQQSPSVNSYCQSLSSLNDIVNDELSKMSRTNELLSAIRSLSTRETSLRIQQMHCQ